MAGQDTASKVLSISYGVFSIRLEGFDNPFPLMKQVTEYIRIIAEEDPEFGTQPVSTRHHDLALLTETLSDDGADLELQGNHFNVTKRDATAKEGRTVQASGMAFQSARQDAAALPEEFNSTNSAHRLSERVQGTRLALEGTDAAAKTHADDMAVTPTAKSTAGQDHGPSDQPVATAPQKDEPQKQTAPRLRVIRTDLSAYHYTPDPEGTSSSSEASFNELFRRYTEKAQSEAKLAKGFADAPQAADTPQAEDQTDAGNGRLMLSQQMRD